MGCSRDDEGSGSFERTNPGTTGANSGMPLFFSADDARRLVKKFKVAQESFAKIVLDDVLVDIEKAALLGKSSVTFSKSPELLGVIAQNLKKCGFAVQVHDDQPSSNYLEISW